MPKPAGTTGLIWSLTVHERQLRCINEFTQRKHTLRLLAGDPLSVVVVTSEVVAESCVDGAVVVQSTTQSVRIITAMRWNGGGVVAFV